MTTAQEVEQYADKFGDSYPATVVYLRQYATILRQTTEGTDALAKRQEAEERHLLDRTEQVWQLDHTEQIWGLCRTYEQRLKVIEAENARLKAAMDKYYELAQSLEKRLAIAVAALQSISEYWRCARTMTDACEHNRNAAAEALARIKEEK